MEAWYAIRVRTNLEKQVCASLDGKGFETYLPLNRASSRWSDLLKRIEIPVFDGYLFSRFDAVRRLPVLSTAGVVNIVGNGMGPLPVDETELNTVRKLLSAGEPVTPCPYLKSGDLVVLERGPLAGARGILLQVNNRYRLVVSVTRLKRSIAVDVARETVPQPPIIHG